MKYKVTFDIDEEKVRYVAPSGEMLSVDEGVDLLFYFMQCGDLAKLVTYEKVADEDILTEGDIPY